MKKIIEYLCLIIILILICIIIYYKNLFYVKIKTTSFSVDETVEIDFIAKFKGKNITNQVLVDKGTFDGKIGKYEITFTYYANGKKYQEIRKIKITDSISPSLRLIGSDYMIVEINHEYLEPGYIAIDNYDGDLKQNVVVTGNIDTLRLGKYEISYTLRDSSGNETISKRIVQVVEKSALTMPLKEYNLNDQFKDTIMKQNDHSIISDLNSIVFVGDYTSLEYNVNSQINSDNIWYGNIKSLDNLEMSNIIVNGVDTNKDLIELVSINKPKFIVINMSPFIIEGKTPEKVIDDYLSIINKIRLVNPNSTIIINSIFPVNKFYDDNNSKINNEKINIINYFLVEMCSENNIKFLNTAESLKDSNGQCQKDYCKNDYLGNKLLTEKGSNIIIEYIKNHL